MKKKKMLATLAVSAAIVLSGVAVKATAGLQAPEPVIAAAKVGKIVPVNMLSGPAKFSSTKGYADQCCGPYGECKICNY